MVQFETVLKPLQLLVLLLMSLAFVGCGNSSHEEGSSRDLSSVALSDLEQQGVNLYMMNCAVCHGSWQNSQKWGRSALEIQNALVEVSTMRPIQLSGDDVNAIAAALNVNLTVIPPNDLGPADRLLIGNADYISSVLRDVFLPTTPLTADDNAIEGTIQTLVNNQRDILGGICRRYDESCAGDDKSAAEMVPATSTLRKGFTTRACQEILGVDKAVTNALGKLNLSISSAASEQNLRTLFDFFYMGRTADQESLNSLASIHQTAINQGKTGIEAWRFVMLPLCASAMTDLL